MAGVPGTSRNSIRELLDAEEDGDDEYSEADSDESDLDAAQIDQPDLPEEMSTEDEEDDDDDHANYNYNFTWHPNTAGMRQFNFTRDNVLKVPPDVNRTPHDWFLMVVDDVFLENICKHTNAYAWEVYNSPNLMPKSRINKWKDLTIPELKIFIGILLHMGTVRINRFNDYWKTSRFFNFGIVREQISRDRWLLILRCLHFNNNNIETEDRLQKVRLLIDSFNNKMHEIYSPGKELALDESIMLYRGRLYFRQYIKGKRHKYGIKFYSLCEPDGLCLSFEIYSGKGGALGGTGHASKVVKHLMRGKLNAGHSLYMDNYYNSIPLAAELLRNGTYCTGTLQIDRKYLPQDVTTARLAKGETLARYAEGILVAKWRDQRPVLYLSTEHENDMCISRNRRGQERSKPLPIIHYNAEMSGVNRHDQLMSYYPCEHKSLRKYKKVFVHIIQMSLINSFKFYRKDHPQSKSSLYDFRLAVIDKLLPEKVPLPPKRPKQRRSEVVHVLSKIDKRDNKNQTVRKRCRQCTKEKCYTRTTYFCAQCPEEPGLCALACFDKWHTP